MSTNKALFFLVFLFCIGCAGEISNVTSPGPVVGRAGTSYIIREFKLDNNVHCYTNGSSISCLQLKVQ
jgi:hypothetical protein